MNRHFAIRGRLIAAVLSLVIVPGSTLFAADPADDPRVVLTARDVDASNAKVSAAYNALVAMWTKEFRAAGARFVPPRLAAYRSAVRTGSCGVILPSNAQYCERSNAIYFDDVFVAAMAKRAGQALGTDGDMAGIGIIAHEMGHAVAMQLGFRSRNSYENESVADCLAGAFARQSQKDGFLEKGDVDEAFYGMASAGDPTIEPTGNSRRDARNAAALRRSSHGTREQRVQNFRNGLEGGSQACLAELR